MNKVIGLIVVILVAGSAHANIDVKEPQAAISYVGFYNSENRQFNPEPIEYGAMINILKADEELKRGLKENGFRVLPFEGFSEGFGGLGRKDRQLLGNARGDLLIGLNNYLMSGADTPDCGHVVIPDFSQAKGFEGWNETSRIHLILGLETLSPSGKGLRSGMALGLFDGNGKCQGLSFIRYNFTEYNTGKFVADGKQLIKNVQNLKALKE